MAPQSSLLVGQTQRLPTHVLPPRHTSLQVLQFWFVPRSVQMLPHLTNGTLQEKSQIPLTQVGVELAGPGGQTLPQIPQLVGSNFLFTHTPPQQDCPGGQQVPAQQSCCVGQQPIPHRLNPPLQAKSQPPLAQIGVELAGPGGQTLPQPPQFIGSVFLSLQTPPQHICPPGQQRVPQA